MENNKFILYILIRIDIWNFNGNKNVTNKNNVYKNK